MGTTPRRLAALLLLLFGVSPVAAQTVTGAISGTVVDGSGHVIPGATVTLIDERTGHTRALPANETGDFSFVSIEPGIYTVRVEHQGFRTFERRGNVLSASERMTLGRIELALGQLTETVTTVAVGARIETESSDHSGLLTSEQIDLISTKGRDVTSLLRLLPGVSYTDDVETLGEGFGRSV